MKRTVTGQPRPVNYIISAVAHGIKELNPTPRLKEVNARFCKMNLPEYEDCFVDNIYDEESLAEIFPMVFLITEEFIKEYEVEINKYLFKIRTGYRVRNGKIIGEEKVKNPLIEAFYRNHWWNSRKKFLRRK